jgi:hypothetical protein
MRYIFSQWENGDTSPSRTIELTTDMTITANYTLATRKLTFLSQPIIVQAIVDGKPIRSGETLEFPEGATITIEVPREVEV